MKRMYVIDYLLVSLLLPCLRKRWRSQLDLVVNQSGHCGHLYGFWPVCVRMCRRRELVHGNLREQYGQLTRCGAFE